MTFGNGEDNMTTPRDNLLRLYRRQGYEYAPVGLDLCPTLLETYKTMNVECLALPPGDLSAAIEDLMLAFPAHDARNK
jgi:hypothetical protein